MEHSIYTSIKLPPFLSPSLGVKLVPTNSSSSVQSAPPLSPLGSAEALFSSESTLLGGEWSGY